MYPLGLFQWCNTVMDVVVVTKKCWKFKWFKKRSRFWISFWFPSFIVWDASIKCFYGYNKPLCEYIICLVYYGSFIDKCCMLLHPAPPSLNKITTPSYLPCAVWFCHQELTSASIFYSWRPTQQRIYSTIILLYNSEHITHCPVSTSFPLDKY